MPSPPAYDAFLSYNSLDHTIVERVAKELATRQCNCFLDRRNLQPGQNWVKALEQAMAGSRSMVIFIGPREMSGWQELESKLAVVYHTNRNDFRVIPVLLSGSEPPTGVLDVFMWIDLRNDPADPAQLNALAAAIRPKSIDRDGKPEPRAMICPYRGLLAFREEDADFFFGRDVDRQQLFNLIQHQSLVAVIGASGSGKSSLVSAGLVPALRRRKVNRPVWDVVRMVPHVDPLYSLAEVLVPLAEPQLSGLALEVRIGKTADDLEQGMPNMPLWRLVNAVLRLQPGTQRLLLFVDQWEELYTSCEKPTRRDRFIKELLESTSRKDSPLTVVLTVRGDFYEYILTNLPLLDRIKRGRLDLGPMHAAELRSVIERPATKVGLSFQGELVRDILDDAGDEPGKLPLIQFVLKELWEKRNDEGQLTHDAYQELGRLTGAIATRAETVFLELSVEEQESAEFLFRRLVQAGSKTEEDTRRRADLHSLDATAQRVARKLADERLLVTTRAAAEAKPTATALAEENSASTGETVEVAHEELLRRWDRLKQWVDVDRQFLQWRTRLIPRLEEFKRDSKSALLTGNSLRESRLHVPSRNAELDASERTFVVASQDAARRQSMLTKCVASLVAVILLSITLAVYDSQQKMYYTQQKLKAIGEMNDYLGKRENQVADAFTSSIAPNESFLTEPLHQVFEDGTREDFHKLNAAYALARFDAATSEELKILLQKIPSAMPELREMNVDIALRGIRDQKLLQLLLVELATQPVTTASYRYGTTGLTYGFRTPATICTQFDSDLTDRTDFIHHWDEWPVEIAKVLEILKDPETASGLRSALCCVIGRHSKDKAWQANREEFISLLNDAYQTSEEPGLHFIAEWALNQWNQKPESIIETQADKWKTNSQKMTMIWIKDGNFMMGNNGGKERSESPRHKVQLLKGFDLSHREVSVEEFMRFAEDQDYNGPRLVDWEGYDAERSSDVDCPVQRVSWLDAVRYCNWLSCEEGFPIAYDEKEWKPIPDAKGYRLPTEAEWEYACRAGTDTEYYFGNTDAALADYAVFNEQTTQPCGSRIPNPWGLFDMHGNVWEWCEDRTFYAKDEVITPDSRVLRGGSFDNLQPRDPRSADRMSDTPENRGNLIGFRISRTP